MELAAKQAIWNLFHDGTIAEVTGGVPGRLDLRIDIAYLRDMFAPPGEAFIVELEHCDVFEFHFWNSNEVVADPSLIAELQLEILSAEEPATYVPVVCDGGELRVNYSAATYRLDTGQQLSLEEIDRMAEKYWTEWAAGGPARPATE